MFLRSLTLVALITISCLSLNGQDASNENENATAKLYQQYKNQQDIAKLTFFFQQMPKGADLHHHYSGAVYAEIYLDWVAKNNYWIDKEDYRMKKERCPNCLSVQEVRKSSSLYRKVLSLWSDMDYNNPYHHGFPQDLKFFSTFGYFGSISHTDYVDGLNRLKKRAISENVQYIESMLSSVPYRTKQFDSHDEIIYRQLEAKDWKALNKSFAKLQKAIKKDEKFESTIDKFVKLVDSIHQGIDDKTFKMRFQTYSTRGKGAARVFTGLFAAFEAAKQSEQIVGVNIVGPENGYVALRDYHLHMRMFQYLRNQYDKNIHIAMHAGELALGMAPPEDLSFHIEEALNIAGAERIGHGIDIPHESMSVETLTKMAKDKNAVEINLTSNEFILGIAGNEHPIQLYHDFKVPIVISTDDPGVSRNNLSSEFTLLGSRYPFNYKQIKDFVYNSIRFSFLSDNEKEKQLKELDRRFAAFETQMATIQANK